MTEAAHALLGPSGAHRWMACPGSYVLEAAFPDEGSWYADEGTAAHTLATYCLTDGTNAADYLGESIHVGDRAFAVDRDMVRHVQDYVDFVRAEAEGGVLLVEQRVPIGHLTNEEGAKGTADAVILFAGQKRLKVIDLKYGAGVAVDVVRNKQAMLYGLGAVEEYSLLGDFEDISLYIHQPRMNYVGEYHLTVAELEEFGREVSASAQECHNALKHDAEGGIDAASWAEAYLHPGEKQCGFCRAKATCPAIRRELAEALTGDPASAEDFASLVPEPVTPETGGNYLAMAMAKVGLIEDWCKSIRGEIERRLFAGVEVEGYKLVEGKQGNRAWADAAEAEATMKSMRLKMDEMYEQKIISPTTAEKLLKKNAPKKWERLQKHVTRAPGKPSVAPATDPRPGMAIVATASDFSDLVN